MNPFAKKFLGTGFILQLATLLLTAQTSVSLGNLPLWFEADPQGVSGQPDSATRFVAHGRDSEFLISATGAQFVLREKSGKTSAVQMEFAGANPATQISGGAKMSGKINYLFGNNPAQWRSGVAAFGQVRVAQIYPDINVVYYGNGRQLEYDFDLAAGVKPETIVMHFSGAENISINPQGELVVKLAGHEIVQHQPVAYQISGGTRVEVQAGYKIVDERTVAFSVAGYDHHLPLVIDPVLSYATFFGGNNADGAWAIAVNPNDNSVYIAGQTLSTQVSNNVAFAKNGYQMTFQGGTKIGDAFVAHFDNTGSNLLYCTYLGGNQSDVAYAIAVDGAGDAFVTGGTLSTNFPIKNAVTYYGKYSGAKISGEIATIAGAQQVYPWDVFVTELDPDGSGLIYSTYLGGSDVDVAYGIALDTSDDAFITGTTYSTNFPVTTNAFQTLAGFTNSLYVNAANAFVTEIAAGGGANSLLYSTYLGGTNIDIGQAISFKNGYLAVAGSTSSTNFPATNYIYQAFVQPPYLLTNKVNGVIIGVSNIFYNGSHLNGSTNKNSIAKYDAFVAEFVTKNTGGLNPPRYVTLLGGTNNDYGYGVAVDQSGNVDVVGATTSYNFPDTTNALNLTSYARTNGVGNSLTNAFLTQVQWNGTNATVGYSQIFGGANHEQAQAVALDAAGNVFITGSSLSATNVTATPGNLFGSLTNRSMGSSDVFITVFKADFSGLLYSAYFGGKNNDYGNAVAVDAAGNAYITGQTISGNGFPVFNANVTWRALNGSSDAFLVKIISNVIMPPLSIAHSGTNMTISWSSLPTEQLGTNSLGLETATNLLSANWTILKSTAPLTNGATYTFPPTNQMQFFRFYKN